MTGEEKKAFELTRNMSYQNPNIMEEYLNTTAIGQILKQMKQKNSRIIDIIDIKFLDDKYINILGLDKINVISCFPREKDILLGLSDKELEVLGKCLTAYEKSGGKDSWREVLGRLLIAIPQGKELISDIKDIEGIDYKKMLCVLFNQEFINPKTEAEYDNYESLKKQKCDALIKSPNVDDKKIAIFEMAFGHNLEFAKRILQMYGSDVKKFPDSQIKDYLSSIKSIIEENNGVEIQKIYKQLGEQTASLDRVSIERQIKNGFLSLYNNNLFNTQQGIKSQEENVYFAGTDFNMLIHSVSALSLDKNQGWKKEAWMRPSLESRNISASYIRNDMMGTAPISSVCFGFSNIELGNLNMMSNTDIGTFSGSSLAANSSRGRFFVPDSLINNTIHRTGYSHNEVDISRIQKGEKKEPDYIVVFKRNGRVPNMELAKEAQKDWISEERPEGLPIVVVDQDLCLYTETKRLIDLITTFKQDPSQELAQDIYYKIKNNRHHEMNFAKAVDLDIQQWMQDGDVIDFMQLAEQVANKQSDIEEELRVRFEQCKDSLHTLENKNTPQSLEPNAPKKKNESLSIGLNVPLCMITKSNQSKLWEDRFKCWYQEFQKHRTLARGIMDFIKRKANRKEIDIKHDNTER